MNSISTQRYMRCEAAALFLFVAAMLAVMPARARADAVTDWNVIAHQAAEASGRGPITSCDIAMAHLAMHDALNAIERRYEPYVYDAVAPRGASPDAAVAAAAHDVLVARIPNQKAWLDAAFASALAAIPDGQAKADGVAIGRAAAGAIVAMREKNGSKDIAPCTPGNEPGVWRPTQPASAQPIGVGLGKVTPFTTDSVTQFELPMPAYFDLLSAEYAADYNEVKSLGGAGSRTRAAERSAIARFWYEPSPGVHIRLARKLAVARKFDPWRSARLFALLHLAGADCVIAGYGSKYRYNFWRPVTAIRNGANDGNPQTHGDPNWNSYLETPNHPEYPSIHAVLCGAWAEILARFFGSDKHSFTMTSAKPYPGITRSFTSFSQSAREAADSRVYAGVHFRSSGIDGLKIGRMIGAHTFENFLRPALDPPPRFSWIEDYVAALIVK